MAITLDISEITGRYDYDPVPMLAAGSIAVKESHYTGEISTSVVGNPSNIYTWTGTQGQLCGIPAGELTAGKKYLLFYSVSGGNSGEYSVLLRVIQGVSGSNQVYARAQHTAVGTVEADITHGNAGRCSGAVIFTSNGDVVQFIVTNVSAATGYFGSMHLVAIPIEEAGFVEGVDYVYYTDSTDLLAETSAAYRSNISAVAGYWNLLQSAWVIPESGDYLVIGNTTMATDTSGDGETRAQLRIDGVTLFEQGHHFNNSNNRRMAEFMTVQPFLEGATPLVEVRGQYTGFPSSAGEKQYRQSRLMIWRLNAFQKFASSIYGSGLDTTAQQVYPGFEPSASCYFAPYRTQEAEHALVLSNVSVKRTSPGFHLIRLIDAWDTRPYGEGPANANTQSRSNDVGSLFTFAAPLVNFARDFVQEITMSPGDTGLLYGEQAMVVIGLTRNPTPPGGGGPTLHELTITTAAIASSSSGVSSQPVGGVTTYTITPTEASGEASAAVMEHTPDPGFNIPLVHPRLWFYANDRRDYLKARKAANSPQWTAWINAGGYIKSYYSEPNGVPTDTVGADWEEPWQRTLLWYVTGLDSDLTKAKQSMNVFLSKSMDYYMGQSDGLYSRFSARNAAFMLDILGPAKFANGTDALSDTDRAKLRNVLLAITYCVYGSALTSGNPGWDTSNPYNNHYFAKLMGACYAALALYGEQPATFQWPYGTGTIYQFRLTYNGITYTDLWEWFKAKLDGELMPVLDNDFPGGMLEEGAQYSKASIKHSAEMWCLLHQTAGFNYVASHPTLANCLKTLLYIQQPNFKQMLHIGDQPTPVAGCKVEDENRLTMLFWAEFNPGLWYEYAQYWMNNKWPTLGNPYKPYDFMLYRHDRPTSDFTAAPRAHLAQGAGWANSRSSWADDAICVNLIGRHRFEEHGHSDIGDLQVYYGPYTNTNDPWMTADAALRIFELNGYWELKLHNTYAIETGGTEHPQQRMRYAPIYTTEDPERPRIDKFYRDSADYAYYRVQGNCAYWATGMPNTTGTRGETTQLVDIFYREVVHFYPGFVIVFDRLRMKSPIASGSYAICRWHSMGLPIDNGAATTVLDQGGRRRFLRHVFASVIPTTEIRNSTTDFGFTSGYHIRERYALPSPGTLITAHVMHLGQTMTLPTMVNTECSPATVYTDITDHTHRAVTVKDTTRKHFVFSNAIDATIPTASPQVVYYVAKNDNTDKHYVFNLKPGQEYFITEVVGTIHGYTKYTFIESFNVRYFANSQGIVEFDPAGLAGQSSATLVRYISEPSTTEPYGEIASVAISDIYRDRTVATSWGSERSDGSIFQHVPAGVTGHTIIARSPSPSPGSASTFSKMIIKVIKSGGSGERSTNSTFTRESLYVPVGQYAEKVIQPPKPFIYPVADIGGAYYTPSPGGSAATNLRDTDETTYVNFDNAQAMFIAYLQMSLDDLTDYYDRIETVRFFVRVSQFTGAVKSPVLVMKLLAGNGVQVTKYNLPLFTWPGTPSVTLYSPAVNVSLTAAAFAAAQLKLEPRAKSYGTSYYLRLAQVGLEILSATSSEKVIVE